MSEPKGQLVLRASSLTTVPANTLRLKNHRNVSYVTENTHAHALLAHKKSVAEWVGKGVWPALPSARSPSFA